MTLRASKPAFNVREKLTELGRRFGLKGSELAAAETVQDARNIISAGRKNLIINGDMRIAQRSTSANVPNSGAIGTVDRWYSWINYNSGVVLMSQENDSPPGFHKSLKLARNDSSSPSQYLFVGQKIEAQNLSQLAIGTSSAKPFTISFWVKSNRPGTYNLEAIDDDGSHQLVKQYKINNSGVWEHKSITFPPNTTGGVPTYDNTVGLELAWWLSSNANTNYTAGSLTDNWAAFATNRRNAGGNPILDTGQYWMITGVQLEVGRNATDFEHRSIGEEIALCQRYFIRMKGSTGAHGTSTGDGGFATLANWTTVNAYGPIFLGTEMRTPPSLAGFSGVTYFSGGNSTSVSGSNVSLTGTMTNRVELRLTGLSGLVAGGAGWARLASTNDYIDFNAEL